MSALPRSWEIQPNVQSLLGVVGACLALFLFLSPLRTFQRIAAKRNTEDFSGTPYVVATSQCATWLLYCALTPGRTAPGITNGLGMLIEGAYCAVFLRYVPEGPKRAAFLRALIVASVAALAGLAAVFLLVPPASRSPLVGYTADVLNVAMYSAPLGAMGTVFRTRSVEFMPLGLSVGTLACASSWTVYAVYVGDATILVPNALGVALALAQLALYSWFVRGAGAPASAHPDRAGLLDAETADAEGTGYAPPSPQPAEVQ